LKSARDELDIVNAYEATGTYRGAAALCGTSHKTVKRVLARRVAGAEPGRQSVRRPRNTDAIRELIDRRVQETDGRISAKRLLPAARVAGFTGSPRNFRRAVAAAKRRWRQRRRVYRPWTPQPGEHLLIDYGLVTVGPNRGLHQFSAVLSWSRWRFVRYCRDETLATTLRLLTECFEAVGGVPAVVLSDRMGCLKGGVVANVMVPAPAYVRLATHFGFRPDFCEAADPESKGAVEALVRYAKDDLAVPAQDWGGDLAVANAAAACWCAEVNGREHSETHAVPDERLTVERQVLRPLPRLRPALTDGVARKVDKLATVRFGSARYSVPHQLVGAQVLVGAHDDRVEITRAGALVATHPLTPPGGASIADAHYPNRAGTPRRAARPRTPDERAFLALGPAAEGWLRAAAAAGTPRLAAHVSAILTLESAHGRDALVAALDRARRFCRFTADDLRAILAAGPAAPAPQPAGAELTTCVPAVPVRSLDAYRLDRLRDVS